jgi:hypothetical protein
LLQITKPEHAQELRPKHMNQGISLMMIEVVTTRALAVQQLQSTVGANFLKFVVLCFTALSLGMSVGTVAQGIPQLSGPVSLSGASTTAQFAAGARTGGGGFSNALDLTSSLELLASVSPEVSHIGSAGKLYVLAIAGNVQFSLLADGNWQLFDGTVAGLGGAASLSSLASVNEIAITTIGELFSRPGVALTNGSVSYTIFVAYDTSANPGELYFSSAPLQFSVRNSSLLKTTFLPELLTPTTLTGATTTAKFFGGAAVRGVNAFPTSLQSSDDISVQLEILPEISHVGAAGNGYVLAIVGGVQFALTGDGSWQLFDGTVPGLGLVARFSALANSQVLTVDSVVSLIDQPGVTSADNAVQFLVFAAYDTAAKPGELFFSGTPAGFAVVTAPTVSALELFQTTIEQQIIQPRCVVCHVAGGVADNTGLIYRRSSATSAANNFAQLESFVASRSDAKNYILTKSTGGLGHGGGAQLSSASTQFANFSTFLDALIVSGQ